MGGGNANEIRISKIQCPISIDDQLSGFRALFAEFGRWASNLLNRSGRACGVGFDVERWAFGKALLVLIRRAMGSSGRSFFRNSREKI
jgi:hypothetical protein